jgi:GntR family transcriptional regulator/MocR family aminotransferase
MKRAATLEVPPISLDPAAAAPLWRQLAIGLRVAIANGRLGPGARLPSTRTLARRLAVSRTTVMAAYDDLAASDLLRGRTGAGSYVSGAARVVVPRQISFRDDSGNVLMLASL